MEEETGNARRALAWLTKYWADDKDRLDTGRVMARWEAEGKSIKAMVEYLKQRRPESGAMGEREIKGMKTVLEQIVEMNRDEWEENKDQREESRK